MQDRKHFFFLNVGHFLDHLFLLIFATAAALVLAKQWGLTYAELIPYATPGLIAFGIFSLPAGWLADRWSREGMMVVFFIGAGLASIGTSTAGSPIEMAIGLFVIGIFAAIYHPVGLAMIARGGKTMGMDIAVNGVWGQYGRRLRGAANRLLDRPNRLAHGVLAARHHLGAVRLRLLFQLP